MYDGGNIILGDNMKWSKPNNRRIDPEIKHLVNWINKNTFFKTLGSCCGHGKYHSTIIIKSRRGYVTDLISGVMISRKKRFYFKDKNGYYYIPEVEEYYKGLLKCQK